MVIRIVAAVLDTLKLTLYMEDGVTIQLPQGDPRIRRIVSEATPQIQKNGFADIDMAKDVVNSFKDFEEKSTKIRFFRVAKEKLKSLFSLGSKKEDVEVVITQPTVEVVANPSTSHVKAQVDTKEINQSVIDEIMDHAIPVGNPVYHEEGLDHQAPIVDSRGSTPNKPPELNSPDTIIAVVDKKIVPGMERIKTQFDRAAKLGSVVGVEKFIERLSKVIHARQHSVQDLLKFLERGDLPIADDGCILIYKVLKYQTSAKYSKAKYADCHSGNVPQWVGARVCMDPSLVDHNRRHECSNGLHVARRGYVGNFGGSVCVMAKLAPEDVIAVPEYDANKMRVCGYNIIFELTEEQFRLLKANKPLTDDADGKVLLAKALQGAHTPVTDIVEITQSHGGGIKVTSVNFSPKSKIEAPLVPMEALTNTIDEDLPVDPAEAIKVMDVASNSKKDQIARLITSLEKESDPNKQDEIWKQIVQIKKSAKVTWERLGVPEKLVNKMSKRLVVEVHNTPSLPESKVVVPAQPVPAVSDDETASYSQRILKLASITPMDEQTATAILTLKKKAKKGWTALKVPDEIVDRVLELTASSN